MAASDDLFVFFPLCSYLFHYICQDRIIYLCITDDVSILGTAIAYTGFSRDLAFSVKEKSIMGANLRCLFSTGAFN